MSCAGRRRLETAPLRRRLPALVHPCVRPPTVRRLLVLFTTRQPRRGQGLSGSSTSGDRRAEALDLVVQRQEPAAGEGEAVVRAELVRGDEDQDALVEREQLQHGQGVPGAVDGAEVVAGERQLRVRRQLE